MDWTHLFRANAGPGSTGAGSFDAEQALLTSELFEPASGPPAPLPQRPPSVPTDLEPAPLFPPLFSPFATHSTPASAEPPGAAHPDLQQPPQSRSAFAPPLPPLPQPGLSAEPNMLAPPHGLLFDSSEEAYLNSFLNSFDNDPREGSQFPTSPRPAGNFSSRIDFGSLGVGLGAGVMGAMDDSIPHFSLDESLHGPADGLSRMTTGPATTAAAHNQQNSIFNYGLGGTSPLSLGNVMSEEQRKVSSWLLQNQGRRTSLGLASPTTGQGWHPSGVDQPLAFPFPQGLQPPYSAGITAEAGGTSQLAGPPSESDMSVKRKASYDQLEQPRKTRGNVRSPAREAAPPLSASIAADIGHPSHRFPARSILPSAADAEPGSGSNPKRRDSKKSPQRVILTEEERRANHIASEQRRRNQIRQGYAELMDLVTTLRDPALGNHPGTAQSTPSKAVILSHAVQFIKVLEEGNEQLRQRLNGSRHALPQMHRVATPFRRPSQGPPPQ